MTKISQLSDIGANLAANDEFIIRDVSDASTPNKKVTSSGFVDYIVAQGTGAGFTQIAAGVGPLARALASSSGATGTLTFSTAAATTLVERARIDSSGRLLVGTSTSTSVGGSAAAVQILGTAGTPHNLQLTREDAPLLVFGKTAVGGGSNVLGAIVFAGNDTNDLNSIGATITAFVDNVIGVDDLPARLVFATTADGAANPTERMRIDSTGRLLVGTSTAPTATSVRTVVNGPSGGGLQFVHNNNGGGVIVPSNNGGLLFYTHIGATGSETYSERAAIDSSGRLLVGTSTANTSGARLQTSDGLTFPATAVASADPNTLDDYEEGTFTMAFFDAATGGNQSATTATLNYTKIGRLVHVYGLGGANINTTGMTSGNILYITLPFANGVGFSGGEARLLGAVLPGTGTSTAAQIGPNNGSRWYLHTYSAAGAVAGVTVGNLTSGVSSVQYISIIYQAS